MKEPNFYAELRELMDDPKLRDEAVNFALQKLGEDGHRYLLEQINDQKPSRALGYVDRHRVLDELSTSKEMAKLIDRDLNLARDLSQAKRSLQPCQNFLTALGEIDAKPSPYLLARVRTAKVPRPGEGEPEAICEQAATKYTALLAKLEAEYAATETDTGGEVEAGGPVPGQGPTPPAPTEQDEEAPATPKPAPAKKSSTPPPKKKKRAKLGDFFKPRKSGG